MTFSRIKRHLRALKETPILELKKIGNWIYNFTGEIVTRAVTHSWRTIKSLWRNAETVTILILAGMFVSHALGEVAIDHWLLALILSAEMISPAIGVLVISLLVSISVLRRKYRLAHAN